MICYGGLILYVRETPKEKTEILDLGNAKMTSSSHQNEQRFPVYESIFTNLLNEGTEYSNLPGTIKKQRAMYFSGKSQKNNK